MTLSPRAGATLTEACFREELSDPAIKAPHRSRPQSRASPGKGVWLLGLSQQARRTWRGAEDS
jgi:hypothetical protein